MTRSGASTDLPILPMESLTKDNSPKEILAGSDFCAKLTVKNMLSLCGIKAQ